MNKTAQKTSASASENQHDAVRLQKLRGGGKSFDDGRLRQPSARLLDGGHAAPRPDARCVPMKTLETSVSSR